jgi:hypothetical protein
VDVHQQLTITGRATSLRELLAVLDSALLPDWERPREHEHEVNADSGSYELVGYRYKGPSTALQ